MESSLIVNSLPLIVANQSPSNARITKPLPAPLKVHSFKVSAGIRHSGNDSDCSRQLAQPVPMSIRGLYKLVPRTSVNSAVVLFRALYVVGGLEQSTSGHSIGLGSRSSRPQEVIKHPASSRNKAADRVAINCVIPQDLAGQQQVKKMRSFCLDRVPASDRQHFYLSPMAWFDLALPFRLTAYPLISYPSRFTGFLIPE